MTQINELEWKLKDLTIRFQEYGEFAGKYTARIEFINKQTEGFTFKLSAERTQAMLELIKDQPVASATFLGENLLHSLNMLPPPPERKEIGTAIEHETVN